MAGKRIATPGSIDVWNGGAQTRLRTEQGLACMNGARDCYTTFTVVIQGAANHLFHESLHCGFIGRMILWIGEYNGFPAVSCLGADGKPSRCLRQLNALPSVHKVLCHNEGTQRHGGTSPTIRSVEAKMCRIIPPQKNLLLVKKSVRKLAAPSHQISMSEDLCLRERSYGGYL